MKIKKRKLKRRSKSRLKQKKKRKQQKEDKTCLPEVNKEFYEIQIADLNAKLGRTREQCITLEAENEEMRHKFEELDEDRADIIAYLKRILQTKIDEVNELQERTVALQQARETEHFESEKKFCIKQEEYDTMKNNLSTEIAVLGQKLKLLDDFRNQREELLKKFEEQEKFINRQEIDHQEKLRTIEKDFILKNIQMKKEVDEKLLKLPDEFQSIIQSKIDNCTKLTMNENNLLNKEIRRIMELYKHLKYENENLKTQIGTLKTKISLIKDGMRIALEKNSSLKREINDVLVANEKLAFVIQRYQNENTNAQHLNSLLDICKMDLNFEKYKNEELTELLTKLKDNVRKEVEEKNCIITRLHTLENIIETSKSAIKDVLRGSHDNEGSVHVSRNVFVSSLLNILENACDKTPSDSNKDEEFLTSVTYKMGKLGIIATPS